MAVNKKKLNSEISQALFSDAERFEMFFAAHWRKITAAAIIVAIAIAGVFYFSGMKRRADRRAACVLADAVTAGDLERALAQYGRASGAPVARLRLVRLYTDGKQYDKALIEVKRVADDAEADATLRANAALTEAYLQEMSGKIDSAAKLFAALGARTTLPTALRAEATCNAGRLLIRQGNGAEAKKALDAGSRLPATTTATAYWVGRCKSLLIALECGELGVKPVPAPKK